MHPQRPRPGNTRLTAVVVGLLVMLRSLLVPQQGPLTSAPQSRCSLGQTMLGDSAKCALGSVLDWLPQFTGLLLATAFLAYALVGHRKMQ